MYVIYVFYCLFFLNVGTLDAEPKECLRPNEHLDCVYPCPLGEPWCVNGEIKFNCLDALEPCTMQCVCNTGFYRSYLGDCLPEKYCARCQGFREFYACGPACDNECSTLNEMNRTNCPILNIVCNEKCYCEDGYARNDAGDCIPTQECPDQTKRDTRSPKNHLHQQPKCPPNEEYTNCKKSCPPETCMSIVARYKCDSKEECKSSCVCKSGFLRKTAQEPCTPIRDCPELRGSPDFS